MLSTVKITFEWVNPKLNNFSFIVFTLYAAFFIKSIESETLLSTNLGVSAGLRDLYTE